jgi:hypothetical protein
MAAKFGYNIRTLANNNFLKATKTIQLNNWVSNNSYLLGDAIFSSGNKYVSITDANASTGTTAPSHTSGVVKHGDVDWLFIEEIPNDFSFMGNLYSFIGRGGDLDWTDNINPPIPNLTDSGSVEIFNDIIALKRISQDDMRFAIKRHDWSGINGGEVYDQYDPEKDPYSSGEDGYTNPFFCKNGFNIYKCINNNNGSKSSIPPEGTSTTLINNAVDGYVWKYMGSIDSGDIEDFLTADYAPVEYKSHGSNSIPQISVQENAKNGEISTFKVLGSVGTINTPVVTIYSDNIAKTITNTTASAFVPSGHNGVLSQVLINNQGNGYYINSVAIIRESGVTGSGAYTNASDSTSNNRVVISNGIITGILLESGGSDYISAKVIIIGEGDGITPIVPAVATANVTLQGNITTISIESGGSGYIYARAFIIPGTAGGVAETILAPKNGHGKNIVKELGANALIFNTKTPTDNTYYPVGYFRRMGIISDIMKIDGITFADEPYYIGPAHSEYNITSSLNKCSSNYGDILYTSNFPKITRIANQSENVRITIIF